MISQPPEPEREMHTSPDGRLALCVTPNVEGETMIGFHGFDWAIAASGLGPEYGDSAARSIAAYVQHVLNDQALIAVTIRDGELTDAWVTEHPESDMQFSKAGETLEFRRWSGTHVPLQDFGSSAES